MATNDGVQTVANDEHLAIIRQGAHPWNDWRERNPHIRPDLSRAEMQGFDLSETNLSRTDLPHARLMGANLTRCVLTGSDLRAVHINDARAWYANFDDANLRNAYLFGSDFREASFRGADLTGANIRAANLVQAKLQGAVLIDCKVYGVSAWGLEVDAETKQQGLIVTAPNEPAIAVDDLDVAQFVYFLLYSRAIRSVIDTVTSKLVLILGRFTEERKRVLDAIKAELRKQGYVPLVFDSRPPSNRNLTETVTTLAHMARFVIVDITDPRSTPQELQAIVSDSLPSLPVQPLLQRSSRPYGLFDDFLDHPSVLSLYRYGTLDQLIADLQANVITPAETRASSVIERRLRRQTGK